ncbi:MAG: M20 family metallopeptidase [Lachnospiraceae bacterium]
MDNQICTYIDSKRDEMIQIADAIFDNPEIGLEEYKASTMLEDWLENQGFIVERGIGTMKTAFRAVYENGEHGPSIGLLCEYDALKGIGHACGHHLQGPCIITAAAAIKKTNIDKPYKLVVYGTPAEESYSGKIQMIKEGSFQDIDIALMMHGGPTTTTDIKSLANYSVTVTFRGKSSHAAIKPEQGRSALDALILSFQGIEFLREHVKEDVKMHYTIDSCGNSPVNVVPHIAIGTFSLRSYNIKTLESILERFKKVMQGAAMMTETEVEIHINKKVSNKIPALKLNEVIMENAKKIEAPRISPPRERTGSTDLGDVMQKMPGSCIRVAFVPENASPHSEEYLRAGKTKEAHDAIIIGAKILAETAVELIENPHLLQEIKNEYQIAKDKQSKEA